MRGPMPSLDAMEKIVPARGMRFPLTGARNTASQYLTASSHRSFVIAGPRIDDFEIIAILNTMAKRTTKAAAKAPTAVTKVIGYIRVSTDKQADEGVSLDAQRAALAAYAALYGVEIVEVIVDAGESAKTLQRPGLARALAMLADGAAEGLLVAKLDRLTRSVRDLGALLAPDGPFAAGKAALLSVSEQIDTRSAAGRLVLNVLASVSQWEREAIAERTSTAMQHMRDRGEYTGGRVPYGWALVDGGRLAEVADEQATIARAREFAAEGQSLREVATALAAEGRFARNGRVFFPAQVAAMLRAGDAAA